MEAMAEGTPPYATNSRILYCPLPALSWTSPFCKTQLSLQSTMHSSYQPERIPELIMNLLLFHLFLIQEPTAMLEIPLDDNRCTSAKFQSGKEGPLACIQ